MVNIGFRPKKNLQTRTVEIEGEISVKKNVVNTFKELPDPSQNEDKLFFVKGRSIRKKRGFYYSNGKKWQKV